MSKDDRQHIGAVNDRPDMTAAEDDARELERAKLKAAKQAIKPRARRETGPTTGDGDLCPLEGEAHGRMLVIPGTKRQHCPHQAHDGRPKSHPLGGTDPTPRVWPLEDAALREAVRVYTAQA